jgi:RNA polymerase sigma factor (sigma-70 family)
MVDEPLYLETVEKAAWKLVSRRRYVDFDDLRQEGVLGVLEYMADHVDDEPTNDLVFVIVHRRLVSYMRRMRLRVSTHRLGRRAASESTTPAPNDAALDLAHAFAAADLSDDERRAFELAGRLETPYAEAAAVMGVSRSTLVRLLNRSKAKLQGGLGPAYGEWARKHPCRYTGQRRNLTYSRRHTSSHLLPGVST